MKPLRGSELTEHVIRLRRRIHQYPELSGEEKRTSALVCAELSRLGIPFKRGLGGHGVLGMIEGDEPGPTVALRADMDALPIHEQTEHAYASKLAGKMHACGHDAHTAMLLGVAHEVVGRRDMLRGRLLLIFQPAEEDAPIGGAQRMMDDGLFDQYEPDVLFAQHVWPKLPVGQFGVRSGYIMGASDRFRLVVVGEGGHASMPHQGKDAIVAVNQVISAIQTIVSRNVDPLQEAVITIGTLEAGYRYNVIPDRVVLEGTVRTFDRAIRDRVVRRLREIIEHVCHAMEVDYDFQYMKGYPATYNDEESARFVRRQLLTLYGEDSCPAVQPSLGGEDFSRFLNKYRGVYYWLGVGGDDGDYPPLHDPMFDIDERALEIGYKSMAHIALNYSRQFQRARKGMIASCE